MDGARVRVLFCDACGAPLDARSWDAWILCRYCASANSVGAPPESAMVDDGRPRVNVGGRTYVIEGHIASGDTSEVYRARWAMRLGELVVLKVNRSLDDADLLRNEFRTLERLAVPSDPNTAALAARLPQPIAFGPYASPRSKDPASRRWVAVYRWRSGFVHTLEDVARVHPGGVDDRIAVWILKRTLELLGYVHRAGIVHGAVVPPHLVVHPRDHGVMLVGFGTSVPQGSRIPALSRRWASYYPQGREVGPGTDIVQAARSVRSISASLAGPVGALFAEIEAGRAGDDAWDTARRLSEASRVEHGPPAYNPLPMPGW